VSVIVAEPAVSRDSLLVSRGVTGAEIGDNKQCRVRGYPDSDL